MMLQICRTDTFGPARVYWWPSTLSVDSLASTDRTRVLAVADYWSKNEIIATPYFPKQMTRDRYLGITTMIHFNNNENLVNDVFTYFMI